MLRKRGEGTEEEVERILEQYGKFWYRRISRRGWREGLDAVFDVGPGQVDIKEEEKGAEAGDGGLIGQAVSGFFLFPQDTLRGERTSSSSSSRERRLNRRCL